MGKRHRVGSIPITRSISWQCQAMNGNAHSARIALVWVGSTCPSGCSGAYAFWILTPTSKRSDALIALDSSVLIAAHISRAEVCAELPEDLLLHHELMIFDFILKELDRKLVEKFYFRHHPIRSILNVSFADCRL
jgi:hypothetical protein